MGFDQRMLTAVWYVSRHNSEQDKIDDDLGEKLRRELQEVLDKPEYARLEPMST